MTQADLFSAAQAKEPYRGEPPYNRGSETSRQAGESVKGSLNRLEKIVYEFIEARGAWGATSYEVEQGTGLRHQTASARVRTLELKKRLEKTDLTRPTDSGRQAAVYRARAA